MSTWPSVNPFRPDAAIPSFTLSTSATAVSLLKNGAVASSATLPTPTPASPFTFLDAWTTPISLVFTSADMGKTYVCLTNQSIDIQLPWPRTGLPNGATVELINIGSQTLGIKYNASQGLGIPGNRRALFVYHTGVAQWWYTITTIGTTSSIT